MTCQASIVETMRRIWNHWWQRRQDGVKQHQQAVNFSTRRMVAQALAIWKKGSLLRYRAPFVLTSQLRIQHHLCRSFRHWCNLVQLLERRKTMEKRLADCHQMVKKHHKVWAKRVYFDHWANQYTLHLRGHDLTKRQNTYQKRLHLQAWTHALVLAYREKKVMKLLRKCSYRGVFHQW